MSTHSGQYVICFVVTNLDDASGVRVTRSTWSLELGQRIKVATGPPRHRAFPSLEKLHNGDLLLVYREGVDHFRTLVGITRQVRSRDEGKTWSSPETIMSFPDRDASPDVGLCQLDDGTLLMPLLVVRDLKRQPRWITSVLLRSSDYGYSWKPLPEPDTDGLSADWWWNTYGKIVQLETGELLWPIARQKKDEDFWRTGLLFSQDRGITWTRYADVARGLADEKYVFPLSRGRLIAHVRDLKTPFLYQAYSTDNGRTWSDCTRTTLYGQCPCLFRTGNGVLLSAHRDMRPGRSGVALAYSFDDGAAWHYGGSLYQPDDQTIRDCSYPTMSALSDGQILCAYYSAYTQGNSDIEAVYLNEA